MTVRGDQAQAGSAVTCGDVLTTDTTLISPLDCSGTALTIAADDITLKCKAQHLTGDGTGRGIFLDNVSGVTVKNCQVRNFGIGIFLLSSSGNTLIKNRATRNTSSGSGGFRLSFSDGNILEDNFAYRNAGRGFVLDTSSGNTLMRNAAIQNDFRGFDLTLSSNGDTLTENTAGRNFSAGFVISDQSTGNTLAENESIRSSLRGLRRFFCWEHPHGEHRQRQRHLRLQRHDGSGQHLSPVDGPRCEPLYGQRFGRLVADRAVHAATVTFLTWPRDGQPDASKMDLPIGTGV